MSSPQRSPSMEAAESNIRKRVCKACDRCRLKKSKCDGSSPCSRCKADNAICVFGERKKSHDKVYPKGYVEMLEQQQTQLVAGLRELYRRMQSGESWPGQPLHDGPGGHPLTHDILDRLDLLHMKGENGQHYEGFEEDCNLLQRRLVEGGAPYLQRRGSVSSNSEQGHHSNASSYNSPAPQQLTFKDPFSRTVPPPTPPMSDSPFLGQAQLNSPVRQTPQFTMPTMLQTGYNPATMMQSSFANPTPMMDDTILMDQLDSPMSFDGNAMFGQFSATQGPTSNNFNIADWSEPNDLDFNNFISATV